MACECASSKPAGLFHARHGAAGGVQVGGRAQAVGHAVAEPGGGLGVAEDHRGRGPVLAEQVPDAFASPKPAAYTTSGDCGTCLPSTCETSRWARLGLRRRASPSSSVSRGPPPESSRLTPSRSATQVPDHTASIVLPFLVIVIVRGAAGFRSGVLTPGARP
ncbi:hypothetical protein SAVIM40S_02005 [Streptomyces avidinii]